MSLSGRGERGNEAGDKRKGCLVKARFVSCGRVNRWLVVAVLVVAAVSVVLSACGTQIGNSDRAFVDKFMKMWDDNDVAAAQQLFTTDAVIYWPEGTIPKTTGIEAITTMVKTYPFDPLPLGDTAFTYVPTANDMKILVYGYKDSHYIACPVTLNSDAYMMLLLLNKDDSKVVNQWVSYMYGY
jgi:hypothetical protein